MIIAQLNGGLGNQMFQYATAKAVSLKQNTELFLDIDMLAEKDTVIGDFFSRSFKLNIFNIRAKFADKDLLKNFKLGVNNSMKISLGRFFKSDLFIYYKRENRLFDPKIFGLSSNLYLAGHWITEKYFEQYRFNLLEDFTFRNSATGKNLEILTKILSLNSICVHIRRSDYISNKNASSHFAHLTQKYYRDAINLITNRTKDPTFFFFSDDMPWVKQEFSYLKNAIFCDQNDIENGHEDLRLMINCKNFIIANSTFSWWGAWLSEYNNKIVIAPKKWFRDDQKNKNEIIPTNWIRIDI